MEGQSPAITAPPLVDASAAQPKPPEAQATAPKVEKQKNEVLPVNAQRKYVEAGLVTHTAVGRKCHEGSKNPKQETAAEQAVNAYHLFSSIKQDPGYKMEKPISFTEGTQYRFEIKAGQRVAVEQGGKVITSITGTKVDASGTFVTCVMDGQNVDINIDELLRAQVMSEGSLVLSALSANPEAQAVTKAYFEALTSGSSELQIEESLIRSAGEKTGVLTSDGMLKTIQSSEVVDDTKDSLSALLEGTSLVDRQTAGKIIAGLDTLGTDLQVVATAIESELEDLKNMEEQLKSTPDGEYRMKLQMQIDAHKGLIGQHKARQVELQGLSDIIAKMPGGAEVGIANMLKPLYDGTLSSDQNMRVISALRKGNMNGLLKELTEQAEKDPTKKGLVDLAKKAMQYGGVGIAAVMVIMIMSGLKES